MAGQASLASMIWMPVRKEMFAMRTLPTVLPVNTGWYIRQQPQPQAEATAAAEFTMPKVTARGIQLLPTSSNCPMVENPTTHVEDVPVMGYGLVRWENGRRFSAPLVSLVCFVCHQPVRTGLIRDDEVIWSRVNGDSRYGYEAYHNACCQ